VGGVAAGTGGAKMGRGRVFPTGRKHGETIEDKAKRGIVELSVQGMFYFHRCFKETLMTNATQTLDTIALFKGIATAHCSGLSALDVIKGHIETLRKASITMGKSIKTCAYRVQCVDAYTQAFPKTAKKTRDNYVTAVVDAVNNGTEFSFSASKGKKKASGKPTEKDTSIYPLLAKLFSHEDFKNTMALIESGYENDNGTMYDIIQSMLEEQGYEIKE
jgi:hypothetical protein